MLEITVLTIPFGSPLQKASIRLRDAILRFPLGLTYTAKELAAECDQVHVGVLAGEEIVGVLLLAGQPDAVLKMRQVAVRSDFQGKGIGKMMVRFSERWAKENGYHKMVLHARETAVPFYLHLDYHIIDEPFTEVGILHCRMMKML
jgi:GNAT superfamily N-acetyltransferase